MKTVRMKIDVQSPNAKPIGRIDVKRVDATTEADIANHLAEDDANAMLDSAKFARRVRRRLGFSLNGLMFLWTRSATGNKASAAQQVRQRRF